MDEKSITHQSISHELKSPINNIRGHVELLKEKISACDADIDGHFESIISNVMRIENVVKALGYLYCIDKELIREPVDICNICQRIIRGISFFHTGVNLVAEQEAIFEYASPDLLQIFLENLIKNSIKYAGHDNIVIRIWKEENYIYYADNGPGVPEKESANIFQAFYRCSSELPGSGLGLFLCRRIAKLHGGDIEVVGGEGNGLTMRFFFREKGCGVAP